MAHVQVIDRQSTGAASLNSIGGLAPGPKLNEDWEYAFTVYDDQYEALRPFEVVFSFRWLLAYSLQCRTLCCVCK